MSSHGHPDGVRGTSPAAKASASRHVVAFYQTGTTTGDPGSQYVSPVPLIGHADVVEVAAFHLNDPAQYPILTLNDDPPSAAKYVPMWRDIASVQAKGVKVTALLGGAAQGTYGLLDKDFGTYYPPVRDALRTYRLDGIDLDVEEAFHEATAERLIRQLRSDFGPDFLITLAPGPGELTMPEGGNLPFLDYRTLEKQVGPLIRWYNTQFYCGNGSLADTADYDAVIRNQFPASKVVAAGITNDNLDCEGYVDMPVLQRTLRALADKYPDFAGAAGWEYALSRNVDGPNCPTGPASWYCAVRQALAAPAAKA
ncbi:glycosyl hydrolase family 18 protein [Kitasatospora sp. NPDC059811]|uniref:glycosyl hydrolase family 18 protein n=1 Tax=Streptomycetaceae TaxID=2062 RepID=UPI0007AF6C48|nr:glycosyl hydrolase family 18 protein [Streptomyces sp. MJM8645]